VGRPEAEAWICFGDEKIKTSSPNCL